MEEIGMRRYYIDDIETEAQVFIELINDNTVEKYFTILSCTEKEIQDMRKEELFRFFSANPRIHLVHKILKDMIIYWTLGIINEHSVSDSNLVIYKWINDEEFEEVIEDISGFKWGDIHSISIGNTSYSIKDILVEQSPLTTEKSYCITGDTHGDLDFRMFYEARKAGYSNIFVCGDWGYIWDGSHKENKRLDYLSSIFKNNTSLSKQINSNILANNTDTAANSENLVTVADSESLEITDGCVFFVDGNHENFDLLEQYPIVEINGGKAHKIRDNIYHLIRGEIFTFNDKKILAFGGANSTDKNLRKEGTSWWPQEVPTEQEKENARTNLNKHDYKVDYIITHAGHTRALKDMSGNYRIDDVSDFLSEVFHTTDFNHWYFGHMHINHTYLEGKSTCINKKILHLDI